MKKKLTARAVTATALVAICLLLAGCEHLFEDNNKRPWTGYAWNKLRKEYEFWFPTYETQRDCIESMRYGVTQDTFNREIYSDPIGCAYSGNNYWRVWFMNTLFGGTHFECIARSTDANAAKLGAVYSPVLIGSPRRGEHWYCV
jgi:hypothetical protein